MTTTSTRMKSVQAPCGRTVTAEHYEAQDDQGLVMDNVDYACGCQSTRQEYHDGSIYRTVVRHDGHVLVDESSTEHGF